MLVTPQSNQKSKQASLIAACLCGVLCIVVGIFQPWAFLLLPVSGVVYWLLRRKTIRRARVISSPFPASWEKHLQAHVEFFRALDADGKERFRKMVQVFLDEVVVSGIRTDADELTRVLVGASAVIPVFGFDDWEYGRLGEVLIYPGRFDDEFQSGGSDARTLGMVGVNHLSGVMILSKPDLINGFTIANDKRNVGIHEFAHLVDEADGSIDGLPAGIPGDVVRPWIDWVSGELHTSPSDAHHIDDYAYTNRAEYFAVLSEYFFESPELLKQKDPAMYKMMEKMYRQDTRSLLGSITPRRTKRIGRNAPCPCGSGKKFKRCCRS